MLADMSKAFTSEETAADPILVRARAPLPTGVTNYVTRRGLALLRQEASALGRGGRGGAWRRGR